MSYYISVSCIPPLSAVFLALGCGAATLPAGTNPHDMSEEAHRHAGEAEEQHAIMHEGETSPTFDEECRVPGAICWTAVPGSSRAEFGAAEARTLAAQHRAAADALAEAESSACAGISQANRDVSPFFHVNAILSVSKLMDSTMPDAEGAPRDTPVGVEVTFKPVHGLTRPKLAALVRCHLARAAAVGFEMSEMSYCPLVVKGAEAKVTGSDDALVVTVTGSDRRAAERIVARADKLVPRS